jgi:hypothetical protein
MRCGTTLLLVLACIAFLAGPAGAKDIKLGGEQKSVKLPNNTVALKTIAVAIRGEDGGWKNIKIDAWLTSKDSATAQAIEVAKNAILARADRELPNHSFEALQSAELGSIEAKKAIHKSVEAVLGHPWNGDVLIHNMLVY